MNADFNSYAKYKDSGLPWLGDIPEHWTLRRMKFLFVERSQKGFPREPLLAATQSMGVVRKKDYGMRTVVATSGLENLKLVEVGDFVISLRSFQGGIEMAHARGIISPAYTVLRSRRGFEPKYFRWYFKSPMFIDSMKLFVTGIREGQNIDYVRLSRAFMPVPPPSEQAAIVKYLNWATGRIDRAIRAKKKIIALLNEQKQAIIHQAVTRGLDPGVRMKPSGIPWLGDIPEHWEVRRIKYLLREVDERSMTGTEVLLSMRMHHGLVPFVEHYSRPPQAATLVGFKVVKPGQFVVNRMQAGNGLIFASDLHGLVSPDYAVFDPIGGANIVYLGELFRSRSVRVKFRAESKGLGTGTSGFLRLYNDRLTAIHVALPPRAEQEKIVSWLREATTNLDTATNRVDREITLIHEYRTRLVSDVVTGKVDVREAAASLPDELTAMDKELSDLMDEVADELEEGIDA